MTAVLTPPVTAIAPRCPLCRGPQHPPGCAYRAFEDVTMGVQWTCPTCASAECRVIASSDEGTSPGDGRMQTTVIECACGQRWELLIMASAIPKEAA